MNGNNIFIFQYGILRAIKKIGVEESGVLVRVTAYSLALVKFYLQRLNFVQVKGRPPIVITYHRHVASHRVQGEYEHNLEWLTREYYEGSWLKNKTQILVSG